MSAAFQDSAAPLRFAAVPGADQSDAWARWAQDQGVTAIAGPSDVALNERGAIAALANGSRALTVALEPGSGPDAALRPLLHLCRLLGADIAASDSPADIGVLDGGGEGAALAARLRAAQISFTALTSPAAANGYRLILAPAQLPLTPAEILASGAALTLVGDTHPALSLRAPVLPAAIDAELIGEMVEERGGVARYAWAEAGAPVLTVRHGPHFSYLFMVNEQPTPYSGLLGYRSVHGEILHVHVQIAAGRAGMLVLLEDQVVGVALGGEPGRSSWLVRGSQTSATFDGGSAAIVPLGRAVRCYASAPGRFQIRRAEGWRAVRVTRVLRDGSVSSGPLTVDGHNAVLDYTVADAQGITDYYELTA